MWAVLEIRIHGQGAQATVSTSEILVAAAIMEGKYGHAIPGPGLEQRGTGTMAFVRIDEQPIKEITPILSPHCVLVMNRVQHNGVKIYQDLREMGTVVINETKLPHEISFPSQVTRMGLVDASQIALEILGVEVTSTVMLGAFAKTTGLVSLRAILENLAGHFPYHMLGAYKKAAQQGYDSTMVVEIGARLRGEEVQCG